MKPEAQNPDAFEDDPICEEMAAALSQLSERLLGGEALSMDAAIAEFPQYQTDIRELWGTLIVADAVGRMRVEEVQQQLVSDTNSLDGLLENTRVESPFDASDELGDGGSLPKTFGDFELLEELGRGGMGVVYRARQISLNRIVALKLILRGSLASAEERMRFRGEAESVARLNHPNIVKIYQFSERGNHQFLSMEYVAGQTLAEFIQSHPGLHPDTIADIMIRVSEAIEYAHEQGVLHRDLKPSNILIDSDGIPHIVDFGLAKHRVSGSLASNTVNPLTRSGAILGTPAYMAPEAAGGSRGSAGIASDVYSLGAILYFCLAQQAPFVAKSAVDTLLLVLEQEPVPPRALRIHVNRDLEMVALKCLQKPTDLRYPSAAALADDLRAFINNESMSARSGQFGDVIARMFRETHHAGVLENWGLLWMWHSLVLFVACFATDLMHWGGIQDRWKYFFLWSVGFGTWAIVFWILRRRMGPVTFVERQIAHVWAASLIAILALFLLENHYDQPVLELAPMLAVVSGMVFLIKAGTLSGTFYIQAAVLFLTAIPMTLLPDIGHTLFGLVSGCCFFFPGLKYYRQRLANQTPPEGNSV